METAIKKLKMNVKGSGRLDDRVFSSAIQFVRDKNLERRTKKTNADVWIDKIEFNEIDEQNKANYSPHITIIERKQIFGFYDYIFKLKIEEDSEVYLEYRKDLDGELFVEELIKYIQE